LTELFEKQNGGRFWDIVYKHRSWYWHFYITSFCHSPRVWQTDRHI